MSTILSRGFLGSDNNSFILPNEKIVMTILISKIYIFNETTKSDSKLPNTN